MEFIVSNATKAELGILSKCQAMSFFRLINETYTKGGSKFLEALLENPLTSPTQINQRVALFKFLRQKGYSFPFQDGRVTIFNEWLEKKEQNAKLGFFNALLNGMLFTATSEKQEAQKELNAINAGLDILSGLRHFLSTFLTDSAALELGDFQARAQATLHFLQQKEIRKILSTQQQKSTGVSTPKISYILKKRYAPEIRATLQLIYELDALCAISQVSKREGFGYAVLLQQKSTQITIEGLWNPSIKEAIKNDFSFNNTQHTFFLTGANMSGKSRLVQALGLSVYLAHCGFPVPADKMSFTLMDGLYASTNVGDDTSKGHSHFYSEINRLKQMATLVASGKRIFVLFDDLFQGTNADSEYAGPLEFTRALGGYKQSIFIIATQIVEVGQALKDDNFIQFGYLPSFNDKGKNQYTYSLKPGVSQEHHALDLLEKEGIWDLLRD